MSLWDRQSAYCMYGTLLLHRSLTTVGWYSWRRTQWQGASVTFSLGSFAVKDSAIIPSRFNSNRFFFFVALWLSFSFNLHESDTSVSLPVFPLSDNIWILRWPCSISSFLNKLTLSPPCLVLSTWWERRQRTFLHSWVLDAALITTPETETWSLSMCSTLCLTQSSSHS